MTSLRLVSAPQLQDDDDDLLDDEEDFEREEQEELEDVYHRLVGVTESERAGSGVSAAAREVERSTGLTDAD